MVLNPRQDEADRDAYERQYNLDRANELEQYKKAIEMCIAGGFLKREKLQEALAFVRR